MLVDDVATFLAAESTELSILSGTTGNITKHYAPSTGAPATLVTLYETPGAPTVFEFSTSSTGVSVVYQSPSMQVVTRSSRAADARDLAATISGILDGVANRRLPTSTGTLYVQIVADQQPFLVGRDANQRFQFSQNFTVWKEPS